MPLLKPRRLRMPYICSVIESSMNLDFDLIIPDVKDRPGVRQEQTQQASDAAPDAASPQSASDPQAAEPKTGGDA